jgi:membrane protease YdiL (CAAX protease family)
VGAFAFILLMLTALGGTMVLVEWYDDERRAAPNGTLAVIVTHASLALASLVLLALFLAKRGTTLASAVVVLLLLTAAVGVTAFLRSRRGRPNRRREGDVGRGFLIFHGAGAALLIVVAVVAVLSAH